MASQDAQAFPAYGRPFRLYFSFRASDNSVPTGWSTASVTVYRDDALQSGLTAYEIGGGVGYVDIPASHMEGRAVTVRISASTHVYLATVYTVDLRDQPGRASRFEQFFTQMWRRFFNRRVATTTKMTVFRDSPNEDQVLLEGNLFPSGTGAEAGEMQ